MADQEKSNLSSVLDYLKCNKRLEREKGVSELKKLIEAGSIVSSDLERELLERLASVERIWEEKHGALMAACLLVEKKQANETLRNQLKQLIPSLLEHSESRIRIITGELVGHLCTHEGITTYEELSSCILSGIKDNMERDISTANDVLVQKLKDGGVQDVEEENERPSSPSAADIFHDTAGWKSLETYMNVLEHAVRGCGSSFVSHITSDLLELLFMCFRHTNRFVRETGYKVLAAIVKCPGVSDETRELYWISIAKQLAQGLADNWSQVRMSSSVATREFLLQIESEDAREKYFPILIPSMCLNRYYIAEGVRLYSQETWRQVTRGKGIQLVETYIDNVVSFYIQESEASNHAVREASCACIAELGSKVSAHCLKSHVTKLIKALLDCFKDESWPVRDAACLACGNFITCFSEECKPYVDELFLLFIGNLEDSIPSVRQGAAVAISNLVKTYGNEMEQKAYDVIKQRLPLVADQPADVNDKNSTFYPGLEPGPAVFGVVKRAYNNDVDAHSNQQMYSCGSLAPKMKRGNTGGCMHSDFHKPAQPWEKSEGCVHLLSELSKLESCHAMVSSLLSMLAETTKHKHFMQHYNYFETIMKSLPVIAKSLGKRPFKQHLELFLDAIFYGLASGSPQLKVASSDCLQSLNNFIGKSIMRGRIEQYNPSYLPLLERPQHLH